MKSSHHLVQKRPIEQATPKTASNFGKRAVSGLLMVSGFGLIVASGPVPLIIFIFVIQLLVFKEVISVAHKGYTEKRLPWLLLSATLIFLYGDSLSQYSQISSFFTKPSLNLVARSTSFIFYLLGLIIFIVNLKEGHYRFQFSQLAATIMSLLFVVVQSHFFIKSLKEGIIWFVLPASFVVANDVVAYVVGKSIGRTKIHRVSPNKTLEGYIGGTAGTLLYAWLIVPYVSKSPYLVCPLTNLDENVFSQPTCDVSLYAKNIRFHMMMIALFASIVAPFGGFLASGFKRAFKVKDFAESIPGHGGFADRMDCQFLMGLFTYLYLKNFVKPWSSPYEKIIKLARSLSLEERIKLGVHLLYGNGK